MLNGIGDKKSLKEKRKSNPFPFLKIDKHADC